MGLTGTVSFTHAIMMASIAISAIVRSILAETLQPAGNGLKARTFGTVRNATGYMKNRQSNEVEDLKKKKKTLLKLRRACLLKNNPNDL